MTIKHLFDLLKCMQSQKKLQILNGQLFGLVQSIFKSKNLMEKLNEELLSDLLLHMEFLILDNLKNIDENNEFKKIQN